MIKIFVNYKKWCIFVLTIKTNAMTTANFNPAYTTANKLKIGSTFTYIDEVHTVTGFRKFYILCQTSAGKPVSISPFDFEGRIYHGFIKDIK